VFASFWFDDEKQKRRYIIPRPNMRDPRTKGNPINEEITANELRVIDANGEQAGIMLLETALSLADRQGFDLVLISPNADPPVAKVMDYGKYRYDQQKREKEAKKKQKIIEVKEIRLSTFIEQHDLEGKGMMAKKFLTEGDKLKVSLRFKGRERGRTERGFEVMERFSFVFKDYGTPEKMPTLEGRSLIMMINPLPPKKEKGMKPEPETDEEAVTVAVTEKETPQEPVKEKQTDYAETGRKKAKGPSDEMDL
jgi:translation initiation factor IF-3